MKNTTMWTCAGARRSLCSSGRISNTDAPVVPTKLAISAPSRDGCADQRRARQRARTHAAADHVERSEQQDERGVPMPLCWSSCRRGCRGRHLVDQDRCREARATSACCVALPPMVGDQRQDRCTGQGREREQRPGRARRPPRVARACASAGAAPARDTSAHAAARSRMHSRRSWWDRRQACEGCRRRASLRRSTSITNLPGERAHTIADRSPRCAPARCADVRVRRRARDGACLRAPGPCSSACATPAGFWR